MRTQEIEDFLHVVDGIRDLMHRGFPAGLRWPTDLLDHLVTSATGLGQLIVQLICGQALTVRNGDGGSLGAIRGGDGAR
ncbi:MAG: hypothetical protein EpisKO_23790 [Epibacterium sp.]